MHETHTEGVPVLGLLAIVPLLIWMATLGYVLVWMAMTKQWKTLALCVLCAGLPVALAIPLLYKPEEFLPPGVEDESSVAALDHRARVSGRKGLVALLNYGSLLLALLLTCLARG